MDNLFARLSRSFVAFLPSESLLGLRALRDVPARLLNKPHEPDFVIFGAFDGPEATFIDIGANRGQSIQSIRLFAPAAAIHAFEPGAQLAGHIERRFGDDGVTVHNCGLGAAPGTLDLHLPKYGNTVYDTRAALTERQARSFLTSQHFLCFDEDKATVERSQVRIAPLDDFDLAPAVVKIDVEGADLAVIEGGWETISSHLPVLMIEFPSDATMLRLRRLGYEPYALIDDQIQPCTNPPLNTLLLQPEHVKRLGELVASAA